MFSKIITFYFPLLCISAHAVLWQWMVAEDSTCLHWSSLFTGCGHSGASYRKKTCSVHQNSATTQIQQKTHMILHHPRISGICRFGVGPHIPLINLGIKKIIICCLRLVAVFGNLDIFIIIMKEIKQSNLCQKQSLKSDATKCTGLVCVYSHFLNTKTSHQLQGQEHGNYKKEEKRLLQMYYNYVIEIVLWKYRQ